MLCLLHQLTPAMSHLLKFHSQHHPVKMTSSKDDLHPFSQNLLSTNILMTSFSPHHQGLNLVPNQHHLLHNTAHRPPLHLITIMANRIIHPELAYTVQGGLLMLLALLAIEQVIRQKMSTHSSQKKTISIIAYSAASECHSVFRLVGPNKLIIIIADRRRLSILAIIQQILVSKLEVAHCAAIFPTNMLMTGSQLVTLMTLRSPLQVFRKSCRVPIIPGPGTYKSYY